MMDIKIYGLSQYKIMNEDIKIKTTTLKKACKHLLKDNHYHICLKEDEDIILFGDIDHVLDYKMFDKILDALSVFFYIDKNDIAYTMSTKENEWSFHWSFDGYHTQLNTLKELMIIFKNKKEHEDFINYIDTTIYSKNRYFRLPNQTNKDKPIAHTIEKGEMQEFIVNYIPDESEPLPEIIISKIKQKEEKQIIITQETKVPLIQSKLTPNNTEIENLLSCLKSNRYDDYEEWRNIGFIINNELGKNGFDIFDNWSKQSTKYDYEKVKAFYENIKPKDNGLKIATLKKLSCEDNPILYKKLKNNKFLIVTQDTNEQYESIKTDFEKNNFKILFPFMFGTIDRHDKLHLRSKKDFTDAHENVTYEKNIDNKLIRVSFVKDWLKDQSMRTYDKIDFLPKQFIPGGVFNTFTNFEVETKEIINSDIQDSLIIKHLKHLCNNVDNVYDYVLKFLSRKVKNPRIKTNTALIFKSSEGVGKDMFFNWFGNKIIGSDFYFNTPKPDLLFGRFTSSLENKLFIIVNETSGKDTYTIQGNIKDAITADTNSIERKGIDPYKQTNHIAYIFLTNNDNPIKIEPGDRRFCGIECNNDICNNGTYFKALKTEMDSGKYDKAFYNFLLSIDSDNYDFTENRPITKFYEDIQELNKPIHISFLEDYIINNEKENDSIEISSSLLFASFNNYVEKFRFKNQLTITKFIIDIKKIEGIEQRKTKTTRNLIFDLAKVKPYLQKKYKIEFSNIEDNEEYDEISPLDK